MISKNHVVIEERAGGLSLRVSSFLIGELGAPVRYTFRPAGAEVAAGEAFGRVDGARQGCVLHAPFPLRVVSVDATLGQAEVSRSGPDAEPLLTTDGYRDWLAQAAR